MRSLANRTTIVATISLVALMLSSCGEQASGPAPVTPVGVGTPMTTPTAEAKTIADFLPTVVVDAFNPSVNETNRGDQPQRGGVVRLRNPANLAGLNVLTISGQPEMTVIRQMTDSLIDRCPETLEYFPEKAYYWREADLIKKVGEGPVEGRILAIDDDTVTFLPGAWKYTFANFDVLEKNPGEGTITISPRLGGMTLLGTLTENRYTVSLDEAGAPTANGAAVIIPISELDRYTRTFGTEERSLPFAKKNCAFEVFLRPDVTWHDGQPFSAADVIFTIDTIKNPSVNAQRYRSAFDDILHYNASDDGKSVTFHYAHPYFEALGVIGFRNDSVSLIPKHIFQPEQFGGDLESFAQFFNNHPFNEQPVYTGPYRFGSWDRGNALSIIRHEGYWKNNLAPEELIRWQAGQPWLEELRWVLYTDSNASFRDLINGRLDADLDVDPTGFASPDTSADFFTSRLYKADSLGMLYTYVGWNHEREIFSDPNVRRAVAMLIPREEITTAVHLGAAIPVSGPFFVEGPSYDRGVELIGYDPEAARGMLAQAGWLDRNRDGILDKVIDGRSVNFEFSYHIHNARDYHQKIADIIKERVEQVGIRMTIVRSDWADFANRVRQKEFDAVRFAWSAPLEADPFQVWHSSQIVGGGDNFISYRNNRIDEICVEIRETFDPIKRWELAREFHRIVAEEQPVAFLYGMKEQFFINRSIRGVRFYPSIYKHEFSEWWMAR